MGGSSLFLIYDSTLFLPGIFLTLGFISTAQSEMLISWNDILIISKAKPGVFSVPGSYPDPSGGPDWGWRTEIKLLPDSRLEITHYNITPQGDLSPGVETKYVRLVE